MTVIPPDAEPLSYTRWPNRPARPTVQPEPDHHDTGSVFFRAYQTARYAQEYERVMEEDAAK